MFKKSFQKKTDGAIRAFDLHSRAYQCLCLLITVLCLLIAVVAIFPAVWVMLAGFKDIKEFNSSAAILPGSFDIGLFVETWTRLNFVKYYVNSGIVVLGSMVCAVVFNGLTAFGLAILKPRGHKIIRFLIMLCLMIPSTGSVVALFVNINKIGLNQSFVPLWLGVGANAFYVILFIQFFEKLPRELIEAARLDGASNLRLFASIILPLSRPIVMVILIFTMNGAWSDFLLPYLLLNNSGKETVMVQLFAMQGITQITHVHMIRAIFFSLIPPTILFLFFQRQITDGAAGSAIKG